MATMAERAATRLAALETILGDPAGVLSVTVDGELITYASLEDVRRDISYWQNVLDRSTGARPVAAKVILGEF